MINGFYWVENPAYIICHICKINYFTVLMFLGCDNKTNMMQMLSRKTVNTTNFKMTRTEELKEMSYHLVSRQPLKNQVKK